MTNKIITDAQVESHINKLREMAGSTDLKEMIRADLRYSGLGLHYWIADNFGPMAAGASVIAGLPIAICGFVWLCSH